MPDALHLLKTRRSVKPMELTGPGPTKAGNRHPPRHRLSRARPRQARTLAVHRFEGDARIAAGEAIAAAFAADRADATPDQLDFERKRLARAPLVIAVVSRAGPHVKIPEWEQQLSAGAAAMNLVIAAHAMGYAASWITEWYAYDRRVLDKLGIGAERTRRRLRAYRPADQAARGSRAAAARDHRHALFGAEERMIPKSGSRFSEKIMRQVENP